MSLSPLEYLYFTEDSIKELKNGNTSFKFAQPLPTLRFLYELCWVMVRGELPFQKCKMALECVEFVDYASQEELGSSLADIVTQLAQDLSLPGENRQRVNKLNAYFELGNGLLLKFWIDKWLGNNTLHEDFPDLFTIAQDANSVIAANREGINWDMRFRRNMHDWEVNDLVDLFARLQHCHINVTLISRQLISSSGDTRNEFIQSRKGINNCALETL
ncbi:hypothetical protein MTR67_022763 [Solanum verrucosum]|uniref:Uncharacterized protein n=1 Tax=Solanum verrucosum TaxID=315347 RepID=A0AAF0TY55_SOLVR|nr:hypothetical protein MTR67_022763 [Solanum verrucosum]